MFACFAIARTVSSPTLARSSRSSAALRMSWRVRSAWRSARVAGDEVDMSSALMAQCMTYRLAFQLRRQTMSKQVVLMRQGEGEQMSVMGARLRFLCAADKTDKSWSMMEVVLPRHAGPPPHDHPWDE